MTRSQSSFHRAQGLGSARGGVGHWWVQRVTAVALVPLTLWFALSLIAHVGNDYGGLVLWLQVPYNTVMMILLLIALFWHIALGLQVIVEDYIHTDLIKIPTVVVIRLGSIALLVAGIVATLRVAFRT